MDMHTEDYVQSPRPPIVHTCATCFKDLIDESFIRCVQCPGFVQCLECCAMGYSKGGHLKTHRIIVSDPSLPPMFVTDWTTEEELWLLRAVSLCGIGNWHEISLWVKTKTAAECEVHYFGVFLGGSTSPLPALTVISPLPLPPPLPFDTRPTESCPSCGHEKYLLLANRKEKTMPAEVNGYMPRRHEFEEEFNEEVEHIVDGIAFDDEMETQATLDQKLERLVCYNAQVDERRLRTKVVEEWELLGDGKTYQNPLRGVTPAEKAMNAKILPLAVYIGRKKTEDLAKGLRDLNHNSDLIQRRQVWRAQGVTTLDEGFLLDKLDKIVRDDKVSESDVGEWNKAIKDYNADHGKTDAEDAKLLTERESTLCSRLDLKPAFYVAIKDLIIREYAVRGALSREEAVELSPENANTISHVHELFLDVGWITE